MARDHAPEDGFDRTLAVRAARRFYLEDRSKVEIASELGISRFKVARLLETARERGVVTITIDDGGVLDEGRARLLADALGISRCVVVAAGGDEEEARHVVGRAAASLLAASLRDGEVVGLGWGRTLSATAEAIHALPRVDVVQMTGATEMTRHLSPVEIVRRIGRHAGGDVVPVFAPLVADDAATAQAFRRQSDIARAMAMYDAVTTAVMSLGSWRPGSSQLHDALPAALSAELSRLGAVAEMGATLVDADGRDVAPEFVQRCVAVTSEQLRAIPRVVGVAAGAGKAQAARALARAGLLTELVADVELADAVVALAKAESR